jgi:periplasmic divalent cation tolerance protein
MLLVLTTAPDELEAERLASAIVSAKLGACVQVLPKMTSFYFWEGECKREAEHLLLIKTTESRFKELEAFIIENHSYDTPEIAAFASDGVSSRYLKWLTDYVGTHAG